MPEARGNAERQVQEDEGYKADAINRARGETQSFADILAQCLRSQAAGQQEMTPYRLLARALSPRSGCPPIRLSVAG